MIRSLPAAASLSLFKVTLDCHKVLPAATFAFIVSDCMLPFTFKKRRRRGEESMVGKVALGCYKILPAAATRTFIKCDPRFPYVFTVATTSKFYLP